MIVDSKPPVMTARFDPAVHNAIIKAANVLDQIPPVPSFLASFITQFEGCSLKVYYDDKKIATVGIGHKIVADDHLEVGQEISMERVLAFFNADISMAVFCVGSQCRSIAINTNQYGALISLTFNIGTHAFASSTLLRRLLAGDFAATADSFLDWDKETINGVLTPNSGLRHRRVVERQLFITPVAV